MFRFEGCRCYRALPDPEEAGNQKLQQYTAVGVGTAGAVAVAAALLSALVTAAVIAPRTGPPAETQLPARIGAPPVVTAASASRAAKTQHLFDELSASEMQAVADFACKQLGCAAFYNGKDGSPLSSCFLSGSESASLMLPTKAAALAYLDGEGKKPARMAQVIVVHGDKPREEGTGIYSVGPLVGDGRLEPHAEIKLMRSLHFNRRPMDMGDDSALVPVEKITNTEKMRPLLKESFGGVFPWIPEDFSPEKDGRVFPLLAVAVESTPKVRVTRVVLNWYKDPREFQVSWLHTIPFTMNVVHEGDVGDWYATNITYCGQTFVSAEELLAADEKGTLRHCKADLKSASTWDVPGPDPGSKALGLTPPPGRVVGKTWETLGNGAVRWGDWELFATTRPGAGLSLHDVRWRGDRIAYELAVSDAQAYYASTDSGHQFHYSDKAYSLSQLSGDLVEGLDCPHGASYFESALFMETDVSTGSMHTNPAKAKPVKFLCVYESDGDEGSLWRHAQMLSRSVTGRRLRSLVVRTVATVGNYDYISEVRFGEDGSMRARNEFAGFPEVEHLAPFKDPPTRRLREDSPVDFGTQIRGDVVANLHSHFVVWKVDLDILGTSNEFRTMSATYDHSPGQTMPKKMQLERVVEMEDPNERFTASASSPSLWRVVNADAPNAASGVPRGYAIVIESAPAIQTLPDEHPFAKASTFAKRHLAVTKRKEDEPHAVHSLDHFPVSAPILSVDNFLADKENLKGEDLVCWVSVGKEHITRSEDIPLISNFAVQFALQPWNYHDLNPAMTLPMTNRP